MPDYICDMCKLKVNRKTDLSRHYKEDHTVDDFIKIVDTLYKQIEAVKLENKNLKEWYNHIEITQNNNLKENLLYFKKVIDLNISLSTLNEVKKQNKHYFQNYVMVNFTTAPDLVSIETKLDSKIENDLIMAQSIGPVEGTVKFLFDYYVKDRSSSEYSFWNIDKNMFLVRINKKWIIDNNGTIIADTLIKSFINLLRSSTAQIADKIKSDNDNLEYFEVAINDIQKKEKYIKKLSETEIQLEIIKRLGRYVSIKETILVNNKFE